MKNNTLSPLHVFLFSFVLIVQFSCSKDSDLLTDYVIQDTSAKNQLVIDDTFFIASTGSVTLDVLANDTFENEEEVMITETSTPTNGTVEINTDNTLTYTPETTEETVDTFTYTTESVNEDESVTVETGNVTVTISEDRAPITGDNVYYVTTTGKASNDGKTELTAWSFKHAFASAVPGDVVYVKAGNYGATYITSTRGGAAGNPIIFIGYTQAPGDILANTGPTYSKDDWLSNGQNLPDTVMPHLEATAANDIPTASEVAFTLNHDYIELHNFMISRHWSGIKVNGDHIVLDNIIGYRFGNWSSASNCWNQGSAFSCDNATGYGIYSSLNLPTSDWTVKNSLIIDAGMAAFFPVDARNVLIENCHGYAYNPGNGSDYLFDLFKVTNSTIRNCYAERAYAFPLGAHRSRSIILQAGSDNNLVQNFSSKNLRLQLENARNNTLEDLHLIGDNKNINSGGIQIYSQSNDNIFKNVYMSGEGIQFLGDIITESQRYPYTSSGENNYFINVIIEDVGNILGNAAISFHRFMNNDNILRKGVFLNMTVNNVPHVFNANAIGDVKIYNSTFSNIGGWDTYYTGATWGDYRENYTANFYNCNFDNSSNGFGDIADDLNAMSSQSNTFNYDPLFSNAASSDYTLQSASNLIDKGIDTTTLISDAAFDFLGRPRGANGGYDIGAYEN